MLSTPMIHHSVTTGIFFLLLSFAIQASGSTQQPNIVILLADDLGWSDVGFHGNTEIDTPALDRIAREGMQLDRFYATPICSPSRSALLTGRDPMKLGTAYGVVMPWNNHAVSSSEHFMSERFQKAGYQTAIVGKWHLGHSLPEHHPNQRGFDHFFGHLHSEVNYFPPFLRQGGTDLQRNGVTVEPEPKSYETFMLAEEAIDFIEQRDRSRPFFLYVPFIAPHTPLQAPQELLDKYQNINTHLQPARSADTDNTRTLSKWLLQPSARPAYAAVVDGMDQAIGRILDSLDDQCISDNTIVMFMSDNGGAAYSVGGADNYPLRGGKGDTYEGGIRVVAAIRWPAILEAGSQYNSIMSMMDVFPTLAAAAGITPENIQPLDGKDFSTALINNQPIARTDYLHFVSEIPQRDYFNLTVFNDTWKLVQIINQQQNSMTLTNQLFRISEDPYEQHDLAAQYPDVVSQLAQEIDRWRAQSPVNPVRNSLVPPPGWRAPKDWTQYIQAEY